jgi:DNA-binding MarR family transcriptional regulator
VRRYDSRPPDYRALAEFRFQIRTYLKKVGAAVQEAGLEPQQHQLLLAIKGLPADEAPAIGRLAECMLLRHHSAVELIDRCERLGLVHRVSDERDHRRVLVHLSVAGEELLARLSAAHEEEITELAPHLIASLEAILHPNQVPA